MSYETIRDAFNLGALEIERLRIENAAFNEAIRYFHVGTVNLRYLAEHGDSTDKRHAQTLLNVITESTDSADMSIKGGEIDK